MTVALLSGSCRVAVGQRRHLPATWAGPFSLVETPPGAGSPPKTGGDPAPFGREETWSSTTARKSSHDSSIGSGVPR
jgi:hypothetical protein